MRCLCPLQAGECCGKACAQRSCNEVRGCGVQEDVAARDLDGDLEFTERAERHEASFNFRFEVRFFRICVGLTKHQCLKLPKTCIV